MAQRELAVVLRDVDLGTWRPPRPDPAPAKNADPTFHEFASDWFATKQLEIEKNTASSYANDLTNHLLPFFKDHHLSADHGGRGRPLPPEQGARSRRDHGGRRERDADDVLLRRPPRPRLPPPRASPFGALDQHAHRPAGADPRRRRRPRPSREQPSGRQAPPHEGLEAPARFTWTAPSRSRSCSRPPASSIAARPSSTYRPPRQDLDPAPSGPDDRPPRGASPRCSSAAAGLRRPARCCWRDVDLANGRFEVGRDKTDAGMREVDMLPLLREILTEHKAASERTGPRRPGVRHLHRQAARSRHNLRQDVVDAVVAHANRLVEERGLQPLPLGITAAQAAAHVRLDPGRDRQGPDLRDAAARAHRPCLHASRLRARDAPQRRGARAAQGARRGPRLGSEWAVRRPFGARRRGQNATL